LLKADHKKARFVATWLCGILLFWSGPGATAEEVPSANRGEPEQTEVQGTESVGDTPEVDVEGSIEDAVPRRGWSVGRDLRVGYTYEDEENRDGGSSGDGELLGRIRIGGNWGINRYLRTVARVAGLCTTDRCDGDFNFDSSIPTGSGIERGDITLDELFLHWFRVRRFDVAAGRLQTKFVTQGGVFAKSLDRNDSNSVNVTWTDGIHGTIRHRGGWVSHLILQANRDRGSGGVRREPLDFEDDGSHVSYFLAFENTKPLGHVVQRALDVSYLPDSLLKDGTRVGRIEDYWGVVGRLAARWPQAGERKGLLVAGELGYAPETPTAGAVDLEEAGDVAGLAWNVVASLMDVRPGHSFGLNYGRTDAGWLLSPQYRENEELLEVRYLWKKSGQLTIEARARLREELDRLNTAVRKREEIDGFVRLTWRFGLGKTQDSSGVAPAGPGR
jgi:hypothetical protein